MKKLLLSLLLLLSAPSFANTDKCKGTSIDIVATIFPIYDITSEISKNNPCVKLDYIIDKGIDMHSYQAKAIDIMKIQKSDLFIYVGGISDIYIEDILKHKLNPDLKEINLVELLGDKTLEISSSYIFEHNHAGHEHTGHDHADHDGHDHASHEHEDEHASHEHEDEHASHEDHGHESLRFNKERLFDIDEHVWLSLSNAKLFANAIYQKLVELDGANKDLYSKNLADFIQRTDAIDKDFRDFLKTKEKKTVVFADRFAFSYLLHDYDIDYYAAFSGCSADIDASFNTVISLSKKIDELNLDSILVQEGSYNQIAKSVNANTKTHNKEVLVLNSMQSIKDDEIHKSYLEIMQDNLNILKGAL